MAIEEKAKELKAYLEDEIKRLTPGVENPDEKSWQFAGRGDNEIRDYIENNLEHRKMEMVMQEIERCKQSPYYFATTYLTVSLGDKTIPFTTTLSEKDFNEWFNKTFK